MKVQRKIEEIITTAEEMRHQVSNEPSELERVEAALSGLDTADSFERWTATLPYPLATVLRRYDAAVELRDRQDFGIRFFEAAVQFVAMYDLSCFY